MLLVKSPFGTELTANEVLAVWQQKQGWEERYRQLIMWGKRIPALPEALQSQQVLVAGCESQVKLYSEFEQGRWCFHIASDARIVQGLGAILLAAYNHQTSEYILEFDVTHYFQQLDLASQLSPSRSNGIQAIASQIVETVAYSL